MTRLTRPLPAAFPPVLPTGNDFVALPDLTPEGAIPSVELISMRAQGLIGLAGTPLLRPTPGPEPGSAWVEWLDHWIPRVHWKAEGLGITETVLAPVGHKGFVVTLEVHGRPPRTVEVGLEGEWAHVTYTLFRRRTLPAVLCAEVDPWTGALAMEATAGLPVVGWAVLSPPDVRPTLRRQEDGSVALRLVVALPPGREPVVLSFYIGVGQEVDGARTTAVDLERRGYARLLQETRRWLGARTAPGDAPLADRFNRNALFNRFFAFGRAIDTEEPVWVTSRSPRYYVSAAFWSRDAFLWSLPGLLLVEREVAREAVLYACKTHWSNAGMHAQYLNGAVLYPGFELDELAAFPVGLATYVRATGDRTILQEPPVAAVVREYPEKLESHRGPCGLYETFLDPSDDPVRFPYLTYDNVLAWRGLVDCVELCEAMGWQEGADVARAQAHALEHAIWSRCVVPGPRGPMFAWSVDGEGRFELYDDPPGSLVLLPYYGFCAPDDPVYVRTVAWIRSSENPWFVPGRFGAPGSAHAPDPWPMAVANDLLVGRVEALEWIARAGMDGGLACETVDPTTGHVKTGAAFATCAGWLAAALWWYRDRWGGG